MIKCLECGFESEKLQWTHFKYKCTGRFKNCKEYLEAYPDAYVTDPSTSKKYGVTESKLIKKYGECEGKARWEEYRKKQAITNTFEYKKEKYGWTKKDFDDYNSSRAPTLKKMIEKYGEQLGNIKWMEYCERQAYTNSKEYFIDKYGKVDGYKKYLKLNKEKGRSSDVSYLADKMDISLDEATEILICRYNLFHSYTGSKLEEEFTIMLQNFIGETLEYTTFTKPFGKWSNDLSGYVVFDIKHKDCIIEFNGDYWHANPKIYKDDHVIRGKLAQDIQKRDKLKLKTAHDYGYRTYTVWEYDFKKNKEAVIKEVIQWMQNGQK